MTEKERMDAKIAAFYELRLIIKESDKETYTKEELYDLLDAAAKEKITDI